MGLLTDTQLLAAVTANPPELLTGIDSNHLSTDIRGCAIDLHIGAVYRPGTEDGKPGSASRPYTLSVVLAEGETAVVQTRESFSLDSQHAAVVFPASSVSIRGLLMTNPGHVDPGYDGPVHVTVINMGREPYALQPDGRLLRALIYRLDGPVASPAPVKSPITQELLDKLSPDFLSMTARTTAAAKKAVDEEGKRSQTWQIVIPLIGIALTWALTNCTATVRFEERIKSLEDAKAVDRLKALELSYPNEKRLLDLESRLTQLGQQQQPPGTPAMKKPTKPTKP